MIGNLPFIQWLTRRRGLALLANAREWLLDCGDGVRLQGFLSLTRGNGGAKEMTVDPAESRIALILHGWEGSAESCYVVSLGAQLLANGFDVLRLNLRDHGESHHLNREIFHSCRLTEVVGATRAVAERFPKAQIFLAGFSLGGNFVLRVSADAGAPAAIVGAVAISPVLDPAATLEALERGWSLYRRYFVRRWSRSLRRKRRAWPDLPDFESLLRTQDLRSMTEGLVRQFTDFASLESYLDGYAITGPRLSTLRFPAAILLAEDDPMVPAADLARLARSPLLNCAAHPPRRPLRFHGATQRAKFRGPVRGHTVRAVCKRRCGVGLVQSRVFPDRGIEAGPRGREPMHRGLGVWMSAKSRKPVPWYCCPALRMATGYLMPVTRQLRH